MDIKITCPNCHTKLIVEDDLVGQLVACDECNEQFTVPEPSRGSERRSRSKPVEDVEVEEPDPVESRPRKREDDEAPDEAPPRRVRRRSSIPFLIGCSIVLANLLVAVGFFFLFGFDAIFRSRNTATAPPGKGAKNEAEPAAGMRIRLSNPNGENPRGQFQVTLETTTGRPEMRPIAIINRSIDGTFRNMSFCGELIAQTRCTVTVARIGGPQQPFKVWAEDPTNPGTVISNILTLE